jgi:Xaa-Pro aminopeptidase
VIDAEMPRLLADAGTVHYRFGASTQFERQLAGWLEAVRAQARAASPRPMRCATSRRCSTTCGS